MNPRHGIVGVVATTIVVALSPFNGARAQLAPPLPAETSDVAVLSPAGPHRAFVLGGFGGSGANVVDTDAEGLKVLGLVPVQMGGAMTLSADASRIFVAESFYSRGNRGTREDVLTVYDGQTLAVLKEIVLPGRLHVVPRTNLVASSDDDRLFYVYDMVPASRVHVVDLGAGRVLGSVDLPGCALALPFGARGFASVCGDGTLGITRLDATYRGRVTFTKPFFDANRDPIFEASVVDKTSGEAWLLSYSGQVYPVRLDAAEPVGMPWSVSAAAGFPVAGTGVQDLAWRPGGAGQMLALHRASKRLYVLMHTGNHWTHKAPGTEVWVLDAEGRSLIKRISLKHPAQGIAVSQDDKPRLLVLGEDSQIALLDAQTGESVGGRALAGGLAWFPGS